MPRLLQGIAQNAAPAQLFERDMQKIEQKITATVRSLLSPWVQEEYRRSEPSAADLRFFEYVYESFLDWLRQHGVGRPASGYAVAAYLLEHADHGYGVPELARIADGIAFYYELNRHFLDVAPINALLTFLTDLSPQRTLN